MMLHMLRGEGGRRGFSGGEGRRLEEAMEMAVKKSGREKKKYLGYDMVLQVYDITIGIR